ncbi:acyltransferase family protein [Hymenobacter pini]|uniref:acyltransferase family protein n=1 Tax=Hymenobacter pini TaxID=2880879 RepID=UPI001CF3D6F1|nr:acyltransferase [Hymenobacter pini]MCA8829006.1 acyltransferase [Hymenobacter pini]
MSITTKAATEEASIQHLTYQELGVLHALRGFCASYVVIFHARFILWSGGRQYLQAHPRSAWGILDYVTFGIDILSSAGYEMVIFFFVLSGFFIRYAQLRKHRAPVAFYINRIVRIYPPFLFASLLAALGLWCVATGAPVALVENGRELNTTLAQAWQELQALDLMGLVRTLSFRQLGEVYIGYNDVYWSLLPEAIFYLAVPLAFWRVWAYYGLSVVMHVIGLLWASHGLHNPFTDYLLVFNFYFAVGAMLYDVVVRTAWLTWIQRVPSWLLLLLLAGLFGALLVLAVLKIKAASGIVATLLAVLSMSTLLVGKVSAQNPLVRGLHKLGVFSFSLYLYHFPLLILCYGVLVYITGQTVFYARYYWLALPLVTAVSYALYQVTERVSVNYFRKV